jgi:hypothetical protein
MKKGAMGSFMCMQKNQKNTHLDRRACMSTYIAVSGNYFWAAVFFTLITFGAL